MSTKKRRKGAKSKSGNLKPFDYRFCTAQLLFSNKLIKHTRKDVLAYGLSTDFTEWERKDKAMGRLMTSMLTLIEQLIKEIQ